MKDFTLDKEYIKSVVTHKKWNTYTQNGRVPTDDELLLILEGKGNCSVTGSEDHPEFAKLRNQLEAEGYISAQRYSINGDRVTKPFRLNGYVFEKDTRFPSASAMDVHFACLERRK